MSGSSRKSLPPLPIVAPYAATPSDAAFLTSSGAGISRSRSCVTNNCIRTAVTLLVFAAYIAWTWPWYLEHQGDGANETSISIGRGSGGRAVEGIVRAPPLGVPKKLQMKWAQYSPWHPLDDYKAPPAGCEVNQVHILQRHGARYPNLDEGLQYSDAVDRLSSANKFSDKRLNFLKDYEYELGADDLVPFGAAQTFESGQIAFKRYANLVNPRNIPFVRAAGAQRVVSSATNWTVGFAAASSQRYQPYLNVIISEEYNNTLNQDCPNAADGTREKSIWLSTFAPPIAERLNKAAPGANLNDTHVFNLLAMCPFESVAKETESPFCSLFSEDAFDAFEYHGDLEKYYKTGYGEPLGRVQGVGYVNELLARLTGKPVSDRTTHNASLEFPLGRSIYADFTHENLMVAVFAAMGLFNVSEALDPRSPPARSHHYPLIVHVARRGGAEVGNQGGGRERWVASRMVPFSSRMVTERVTCVRESLNNDAEEVEVETFVRVLVNDEVQPLEFCGGGEERMCSLERFVESQEYARRSGEGDFKKCYN